jgi:hypothetical protein
MKNLKINNLNGKVYFPIQNYNNDQEFFNNYFILLDTVKKNLRELESKSLITGFYINHINSVEVKHSIRVTYFVDYKNKATTEEEFFKISNNNKNNESPVKGFGFGGGYPVVMGLRGMQFLNTYTHIGLDLLEKSEARSVRNLISRYRLKIVINPQQKIYDDISISKEEIKLIFANFFTVNSQFFNTLDSNLYSKDDFWEDLARYRIGDSGKSIGYFGHFLMNMFLISDQQVLIRA